MPDDTAYLQGLINAGQPVPSGAFYASGLTVGGSGSLRGASKWTTTIFDLTPTGNLITANAGASIGDLSLRATVAKTGGNLIYHPPTSHDVSLNDIWFQGGFRAIYANGGGTMRARDININDTVSSSESILIDNGGGARLTRFIADNNPASPPLAHLRVRHSGEMIIDGCDFIHATNCVLVDPDGSLGQAVTTFWAHNSFGDTPVQTGWAFRPINGGVIAMAKLDRCEGASGILGFDFDATGGRIDGVSVTGAEAVHNATLGIRGINVANFRVFESDIAANALGLVMHNIFKGNIAGNTIGAVGNNPGNGWGVDMDGPSNQIMFSGNDLTGNTSGTITGPISGMTFTGNIGI